MDGGVCIRAGTDADIVTLDRVGEGLGRSIASVAARAPGFVMLKGLSLNPCGNLASIRSVAIDTVVSLTLAKVGDRVQSVRGLSK